jgi:hypothetical protein
MKKHKFTKVVSKGYKIFYVHVDNKILTVKYAFKLYPEQENDIIDTIKNKDTKNAIVKKRDKIPNETKIVNAIMQQSKKILTNINLGEIKGKHNNVKLAGLIFDYITKNTNYDMTCVEDSDIDYSKVEEIDKKAGALEYKLKFNKTVNQNDKQKSQIKKQIKELDTQADNEHTFQNNNFILKNIYNVLVNNKGTKLEMAQAYSFLLRQANIKNVIATIFSREKLTNQTINLVEFKNANKKKYFVANLYKGQQNLRQLNSQLFAGFLEEKNKYFNDELNYKINKIEQLNQEKIINYSKHTPIYNFITDEKQHQSYLNKTIDQKVLTQTKVDLYLKANSKKDGFTFYKYFDKDPKLEDAVNLDILRVFINKKFKHNYISINGSIYTQQEACKTMPKYKNKIKQVANMSKDYLDKGHLLNNKYIVIDNFFEYPSKIKMQVEINKKTNELIEKYGSYYIENPKDLFSQTDFIAKVYNHLAKNSIYDMSVREEMNIEQKFDNLNAKRPNIDFNNKELNKDLKKYNVERQEVMQDMFIKSLYNVFVRNKGVCFDLTNALNYCLNKAGIPSKTLRLTQKNSDISHDVNMIPINFEEQEKTIYYIADITKAVTDDKNENKKDDVLKGFGVGKYQVLKKYNILSVIDLINEKQQDMFTGFHNLIKAQDAELINDYGIDNETLNNLKANIVVYEFQADKEITI